MKNKICKQFEYLSFECQINLMIGEKTQANISKKIRGMCAVQLFKVSDNLFRLKYYLDHLLSSSHLYSNFID